MQFSFSFPCERPSCRALAQEEENYYTTQLITYIGNKRSLIHQIKHIVDQVALDLGQDTLVTFDGFSGSGVVSRVLKSKSKYIVSNDLEAYAQTISRCFLSNRNEVDLVDLQHHINLINQEINHMLTLDGPHGFIEELYAPHNDLNIQPGERVFYTTYNARKLDLIRQAIQRYPEAQRPLFLGPLLSEASIHANTPGVFKGFYKNPSTGIGMFGGQGQHALSRIKGEIHLKLPILSQFNVPFDVYQEDINLLVDQLDDSFDLAYLDPPYNQHPYGSNYFMLNLINHYQRPQQMSKVSGIPTDWTRSKYNSRKSVFDSFEHLIAHLKAKYILISYNSEGFVSKDQLCHLLGQFGQYYEFEIKYNAFKGSRNLHKRKIHVKEYLFLLKKK